uniref:MOB member 4, phocein n=1 Tax=Sphaerodactylus townsendi TaxID=933632 RepID=A0ACB8G128_9SAUR
MDSTLAVQQYIQQNIRADCSNIDKILEPPEGQDEGVWKYEHLRQFCLELNGLAVKLQTECHPDTCTQMTATEQWIFLCAAHKTPKETSAVGLASFCAWGHDESQCGVLRLDDPFAFHLEGPGLETQSGNHDRGSRFTAGEQKAGPVSIKESSVAKLGSVCRRIYRIFSHAYFHHRQIFDEYENETFLCHRFTKFVMKYNLMSKDNLIVPILEEEVQNSVSGETTAGCSYVCAQLRLTLADAALVRTRKRMAEELCFGGSRTRLALLQLAVPVPSPPRWNKLIRERDGSLNHVCENVECLTQQ